MIHKRIWFACMLKRIPRFFLCYETLRRKREDPICGDGSSSCRNESACLAFRRTGNSSVPFRVRRYFLGILASDETVLECSFPRLHWTNNSFMLIYFFSYWWIHCFRRIVLSSLFKLSVKRSWKLTCVFLGRYSSIRFKESSKPIDKTSSASSSTKNFKLSQLKLTVSSKCCNNRPGVATRMFIWSRWSLSCLMFFPPMINPNENSWNFEMCRMTSNTWRASSLVGTITRPPSPSRTVHFSLYSFSMRGTEDY